MSSNKAHLRREPPKWRNLPTTADRYPEVFKPYIKAIAQWADQTENPEESLNRLLAIAQQLDQQN